MAKKRAQKKEISKLETVRLLLEENPDYTTEQLVKKTGFTKQTIYGCKCNLRGKLRLKAAPPLKTILSSNNEVKVTINGQVITFTGEVINITNPGDGVTIKIS